MGISAGNQVLPPKTEGLRFRFFDFPFSQFLKKKDWKALEHWAIGPLGWWKRDELEKHLTNLALETHRPMAAGHVWPEEWGFHMWTVDGCTHATKKRGYVNNKNLSGAKNVEDIKGYVYLQNCCNPLIFVTQNQQCSHRNFRTDRPDFEPSKVAPAAG